MKPKILFILHYPPPVHGAAIVGQYIRESEIINSAFEGRYINLGTSRSVEEIGKNPAGKIFRYMMLLGRVFKMLVTFKPDVCYLTPSALRLGFYKDAPLITLAKFFNVKVVLQFHNKGISKWKNSVIDKIVCGFIFKNANVILLSKYLYYDIQKYVPESKVYYCANGIKEIDYGLQITNKKNRKKVEILFLSNLIESKGVYVLLEACKILKDKKIAFQCTLVGGIGDISEPQLISQIKQRDLVDCIQYAGKKYTIEKSEAYLHSDIFVFPTFYSNECFPLVLLEAMQCSLPVITTFEGGIPDIVEDEKTGYLIPQKDILSLADRLEILINNPLLRLNMGIAGRLKYEQEFTLAIFENRFIDILQDIALKVTK